MREEVKQKTRRFIGFSICNAPGTLVELSLLWLLTERLFHGQFGQFIVAPIIAFECAVVVDFFMFWRFVWHDKVKLGIGKSLFKRLVMFNMSTAGVYLLRLALIQILHLVIGLNAVLCDLVAMFFSGLLNFGIDDHLIFTENDGHNKWVRLLMGIARPFVSLKVQGLHNLPDSSEGPVVYICNHGFLFGPIAAVFNLPGKFRPWVDSKALNIKECSKVIERMMNPRLKLFSHKAKHRITQRISQWTVSVIKDFNPIPVFKNSSRNIMNTIKQSVDTLVSGENLLIFPEHSRTDYDDLATEKREAAHMRSFYSGFARIAQDFYARTGQALKFVPVYINQKHRTMHIAPHISYHPSTNEHADRESLSERLFDSMIRLSGQV